MPNFLISWGSEENSNVDVDVGGGSSSGLFSFLVFYDKTTSLCTKPRLLKCKVQVGFRNEYSAPRHSAREICEKRRLALS